MDDMCAQRLAQLTEAFYAQVSDSFSSTRQDAWPGWQRVLHEAELNRAAANAKDACIRVLDLACGNLRFERFLSTELVATGTYKQIDVHALDSCDKLASTLPIEGVHVHYTHLNVSKALFEKSLQEQLGHATCDLAVCFGFMHHVPLPQHRVQLLRALAHATAPGGMVAVSFWQLSKSERLLRKARETTPRAAKQLGLPGLEANDYLLGWQNSTDVWRYCHDFAEWEIDELAARAHDLAREVARFSADGTTGNLNRYLVLRTND